MGMERTEAGGARNMTRPYGNGTIAQKRIDLHSLTEKVNADDYPIADLPSDLKICFTCIAEILDVIDSLGISAEVQSVSRAFLEHLEPLNEELKHLGEMAL